MKCDKIYIAIDLKSFYASVECKERNRDPLTTNLVVADQSRTQKTICLAVSPALKKYGIPGRPRLFEVIQKVKEANSDRKWKAPNHIFTGTSDDSEELCENPALEIDYIVASPRMALYMEYSTKIYNIYLKYIAPEDIHIYSIDEVFLFIFIRQSVQAVRTVYAVLCLCKYLLINIGCVNMDLVHRHFLCHDHCKGIRLIPCGACRTPYF